MSKLFKGIGCWLLLIVVNTQLLAQPLSPPGPPCGTQNPTPQQIRSLTEQGRVALERKRASRAVFTAITYVPIRPHIVRRSDGTGGLTLAHLNQAMALANSYYLSNGYGIQFYFAGTTPDYIDSDKLFNNLFPYPEGATVDGRDAANALNQYYVPYGSVSGYAYYPFNGLQSTRSFIATQETAPLPELVAHELGHTFSLLHTFGDAPTSELVTRGPGANCSTNGDLLCDTPADPYGKAGTYLVNTVGGCPQYDPTSTARDAAGMAYSPSITNIMSYYKPCTHDFTPDQYSRMQEGLAMRQAHTAYSLDAPPTDVAAPSNLQVNVAGSLVSLTWQDNASNEMGYFIERSTSPSTGFVPIGGVGPNMSTFTDNNSLAQGRYYYRLRPSNATTASISSTVAVTLSGLSTTITGTYAQLSWPSLGTNVTYELQWRAVGAPDWIVLPNLTSTTAGLSGLTSNTTYEWRIKLSGSDHFEGAVSFTIPCQAPATLSVSAPSQSAYISWSPSVAGQTYSLRWRLVGAPDWTYVPNPGSTSRYVLTGLQPTTDYQWQVQGVCSPTSSSPYSYVQTFTTSPCPTLNSLQAANIGSSSAYLTWVRFDEPGQTTDLRYRVAGRADWTLVSNIPTMAYGLSGLVSNTQYQWQVRTHCPSGPYSDFSSLANFTTRQCAMPTSPSTNSTTDNSATLGWYTANWTIDARAEIRWRAVGTADWTMVGSLSLTAFGLTTYTLPSLASSTQYEWQLSIRCSPTESTAFSSSLFFQTKVLCEMYTVKGGNWNDQSVWSCGRVPVTTDVVHIKHGVILPQNYQGEARRLLYDSPVPVTWQAGARLRLSQ